MLDANGVSMHIMGGHVKVAREIAEDAILFYRRRSGLILSSSTGRSAAAGLPAPILACPKERSTLACQPFLAIVCMPYFLLISIARLRYTLADAA